MHEQGPATVPRARAHHQLSMPRSVLGRRAAVLACASRRAHRGRFSAAKDWLRLSLLGGLLLTFSCLLLMSDVLRMAVVGDSPGVAAMLAGMTIAIFLIKIAERRLYLDWLTYGAFGIGIGYALVAISTYSDSWSPLCLIALMIASGATRLWIGLTMPYCSGRWMQSSGYVAIIGAAFVGIGYLLETPIRPNAIVGGDLLFQGVAIVGLGLSLTDARGAQKRSSC
ncbi:hypothetical protein [Tardiphaga sp.]|uniref:hypothetical protein n=1 Tax=Tardiphaga sp. TaxID=1926292 RepID=UPI00352A75A4